MWAGKKNREDGYKERHEQRDEKVRWREERRVKNEEKEKRRQVGGKEWKKL